MTGPNTYTRPEIDALGPPKLHAVPLGEIALAGNLTRQLQPWEFASFEAFSRGCSNPVAARTLLGPSFGHTAAEVEMGRRATIQWYGANSQTHATAIAIERGDIALRPGGLQPPPPPPLKMTLDYLARGWSTTRIATAMSSTTETIETHYADIRAFYGNTVNLSSALRLAYERAHKRFPYVGLGISNHSPTVDPYDLLILIRRSMGMTNAETGASLGGADERSVKSRITQTLMPDLGANNTAEAITKTILLGYDLGLTFDATVQGSPTERERQVGVGICLGLSNKEIARQLKISIPTINTHVRRLALKLYGQEGEEGPATASRGKIVRYMFDTKEVVAVTLPTKPSLPERTIPKNSGTARPGPRQTVRQNT